MKAVYIGDSSEEENVDNDFSQIINNTHLSRLSKTSYILTKIGQSLLESVREKYIDKKLTLRKKIADKLKFNIEKGILSDYLKYKNSSLLNQTKFENSLILKGKSVLSNSFLETDLKMIYYERDFYHKRVLPFVDQKLIPLLTSNLVNFIYNNIYHDDIWNTLEIDSPKTLNDFLLKVIKVTNSCYLFINQIDAVNNLVNNIKSNILVKNLIDKKGKKQFKAFQDLKVKEFIELQVKHYVHNVYNKKHVKDIYNDLHKYNIETPHEFLQFYKKFSHTEIAATRNILIKNMEKDKQSLYEINFALETINLKNAEINSELIKYRPKQVFAEDFSSNLVDFLLDHRILRSKIKEVGIKQEERDVTHNKYLPLDQTDEKLKIYPTGARADLRFLHGSDSYQEIAKKLESSGIESRLLKTYMIQIIQGTTDFKNNEVISYDNKVYLYKLADLLFNLETERNVSAFLTNAMFFDLLEQGKYTIRDLPNKLPMAMDGAVDASRFNQKTLPLKKYHKFDFKEANPDPKDVENFNLRNTNLIMDWLLECDITNLKMYIQDTLNIESTTLNDFIEIFGNKSNIQTLKTLQKKEDFKCLLLNCNNLEFLVDECKAKIIISTKENKFEIDFIIQSFMTNNFYNLVKEWYNIEMPYLKEGIVDLDILGENSNSMVID